MTEFMDVSGSLRKIARELSDLDVYSPEVVAAHLDATSFLLLWIADGLDKELELAARRAKKQIALAPVEGHLGLYD